ncbi:hybrid sensor histidine kinase/response regulator [Planctobacterium marinum]|uniref:hybrid sensor histidine kinase/response regulator n=1 Tax=Planctobacterium marinum TaxID=1631968 RepID=UPI001E415141|nr:ATP-binding protein [Planctobacterium marinum]MCC2604907.1 response regulator [Planctobacterium marinum]
MEALSLTGFKTRSTISLLTALAVLLMSYAIQQHYIELQKLKVLQASLAKELSERAKTLELTLQALISTSQLSHRRNLKHHAVEQLSRITENRNYFRHQAFNHDTSDNERLTEPLYQQLEQLITVTRDALNDDTTPAQHFISSDANRDMLTALRQLADNLYQEQQSHQEQQLTRLQQTLILSVTLITVALLFVVLPVLRRVKNDKAAIERQRTQIARIRHTFDTFTDHSQNGVLNYEKATGKINFVNQSFVEMLQYQHKSQLLGEPVESVCVGHNATNQNEMSGKVLALNGTAIPVFFDQFSSHRIDDGAELIWLNITDLRSVIEVEQRSQNAQKMESMGTLASGIAHDFNNILAIIRGSSELLKLSVALNDSAQKCVNHIIEAGERGASLVRQILQFSRADTEYLKVIDIAQHISQTLELLAPGLKKKCTVNFACHAQGNILADESSVSQILINLVKNASQAGATSVDLTLTREGDDFLLAITDNGSGIAEEAKHKLFEPFFSTKKKTEGTGLGLSVVHGVIQKLDGSISVHSEPQKGTTFVIRLPATPLQAEENIPEPSPQKLSGTEQILLVEDEASLRNIYSTYLTMKGYKVTEASNGQEVLALFQQAKHQFDVLVTDHNMPGLLGSELILAIRHLSKKPIRTIMVTGDIEDAAKELKNQGMIDEILTKPIALNNLDSAIESPSSSVNSDSNLQ